MNASELLKTEKGRIVTMSGISIAICLISFQFMSVYVSAGHTIVKRKAPEGKLYVFSERDGCASVVSKQPCTLSWPLSPLQAKIYEQQNQAVKLVMERFDVLGIGYECRKAVEKGLCSQAVPRCSAADNSSDYGDALNECRQNVYTHCADTFKQSRFCQNLKTGKSPKSQCVAPSSPVGGICPQPKFKMTEDLLADYRKNSESDSLSKTFKLFENLKYINGEKVYSDKCLSFLKEISCSSMYCSADESLLLTEHDQDDCNNIINECFDDIFSKLSTHPSSSIRRLVESSRKTIRSTCDTFPPSF